MRQINSDRPALSADSAASAASAAVGDDIRVGSPFRGESHFVAAATAGVVGEAFYDIGPARYLAWGAVIASAMSVVELVPATIYFPAGGIAVAVLGGTLAVIGLASPRPLMATALLGVHLVGLIWSYQRIG